MFPVGERILLTLWVGGMWAIGFLAAPVLFANLEDRALAGTLAGILFEIVAWIGLLCSVLLMLGNQLRHSTRRANWRMLVLLAMFCLVAAGQFVLAPMVAELRAAGEAGSATFARVHGIASTLYLITCLFGLLLVAAAETADA